MGSRRAPPTIFASVAANAIGATTGVPRGRAFSTLPQVSLGLPDGRAYELVTPPDKGDAADMFATPESEPGLFVNQDTGFASESGEQFLITTEAAFGSFPASERNAYVFSRTPAGWTYASLASPSLGVQGFRSGPSTRPISRRSGSTTPPGHPSAWPARDSRTSSVLPAAGWGPYATPHVDSPVREGEGTEGVKNNEQTEIVGGSRGLSHVVLESQSHTLAPGATGQDAGTTALYEWAGGGECGSRSL